MIMITNNLVLPTPIPETLASWLQERAFDVCPWYEAPSTSQKIIGKDAWRFANIVLYRAPIGTDEVRYYVAICPPSQGGTAQGKQMVGYWLEVQKLTEDPDSARAEAIRIERN